MIMSLTGIHGVFVFFLAAGCGLLRVLIARSSNLIVGFAYLDSTAVYEDLLSSWMMHGKQRCK